MTSNASNYISRSKQLQSKKRLPNVLPTVIAIEKQLTIRSQTTIKSIPSYYDGISLSNRFSYRLVDPSDQTVLECLVLHNGICVLLLPRKLLTVENDISTKSTALEHSSSSSSSSSSSILSSNEFELTVLVSSQEDEISGKRKKGAYVIQAGEKVLRIQYSKSEIISYRCPIGGQLLEVNDKISVQNLQDNNPVSSSSIRWSLLAFICIILPNTVIPCIPGPRDYQALLEERDKMADRSCFAWKKGECWRGNACKFVHDTVPSATLIDDLNSQQKKQQQQLDSSDVTQQDAGEECHDDDNNNNNNVKSCESSKSPTTDVLSA